MTTINQTSNLEYCETCGTMLVMGECRRCNPVTTTRTTSPRIVKKSAVSKTKVHTIGVDYVTEKLIDQGITTTPSDENGIDLVLDNGKTILVRAMSNEIRVPLINSQLNTLKADYLIIVANLNFTTIRKIYIMTLEEAKNISI